MVDIWGRSTRKKTKDGKTPDDVKKLIKDEIASNFNLVSIDPGEIVVFEDRQGKLKSSNVSFDDLLTKQDSAPDDSLVLSWKYPLQWYVIAIPPRDYTIAELNDEINE